MTIKNVPEMLLHDFEPSDESFFHDVIRGLKKPQKELPSKYFYDARGSWLFDRITELDEYYLARTEIGILREILPELKSLTGTDLLLFEYGSGSSIKTCLLLDALDISVYVPIDISKDHLRQTVARLMADYPHLEVIPVCADYLDFFVLPPSHHLTSQRLVFFPGSTIGNYSRVETKELLTQIHKVCGPGGALLIGVDMKKNPKTIEDAYNDFEGVTAAFNKNILERINRELEANFDLDQFTHRAFYNENEGRVEMHLVSRKRQTVSIAQLPISFEIGESILTEVSYKYTTDEFSGLVEAADFSVDKVWTDTKKHFAVFYISTL